jgi:hypothetical protein
VTSHRSSDCLRVQPLSCRLPARHELRALALVDVARLFRVRKRRAIDVAAALVVAGGAGFDLGGKGLRRHGGGSVARGLYPFTQTTARSSCTTSTRSAWALITADRSL